MCYGYLDIERTRRKVQHLSSLRETLKDRQKEVTPIKCRVGILLRKLEEDGKVEEHDELLEALEDVGGLRSTIIAEFLADEWGWQTSPESVQRHRRSNGCQCPDFDYLGESS